MQRATLVLLIILVFLVGVNLGHSFGGNARMVFVAGKNCIVTSNGNGISCDW